MNRATARRACRHAVSGRKYTSPHCQSVRALLRPVRPRWTTAITDNITLANIIMKTVRNFVPVTHGNPALLLTASGKRPIANVKSTFSVTSANTNANGSATSHRQRVTARFVMLSNHPSTRTPAVPNSAKFSKSQIWNRAYAVRVGSWSPPRKSARAAGASRLPQVGSAQPSCASWWRMAQAEAVRNLLPGVRLRRLPLFVL